MKGNKRILISISIRKLRVDIPPSRYTFADVLAAIQPHWTRKRVPIVSNNNQADKNAERRLNAHDYLVGTQALRKRLRCSFVDAETLIQEQAIYNEAVNTKKTQER